MLLQTSTCSRATNMCYYPFVYRSDRTAVIRGTVLEVLYETSREAFVFRYQDLDSSDINYIAIDDLATCDWEQKGLIYIIFSRILLLMYCHFSSGNESKCCERKNEARQCNCC